MDEKVKRGRKPKQPVQEVKKETPEKVKEVKIETREVKEPAVKIPTPRRNIFEVIVNGNSREMSKQSYEVIVKDPNYTVELPKGSRLTGGPTSKPCKDC